MGLVSSRNLFLLFAFCIMSRLCPKEFLRQAVACLDFQYEGSLQPSFYLGYTIRFVFI